MNDEVKIFVYGSCVIYENSELATGNGGYGAVIFVNERRTDKVSGGFSHTTNARMEMYGIIEGLRRIKSKSKVIVFLLSGNIVDTFTKGWLENWKRNGFKKIKNVDLWKEIDRIIVEGEYEIKFERAQELRNSVDFLIAEKLAKTMSNKQNLQRDLPKEEKFFSENIQTCESEIIDSKPITESVCVDASTIGNPGVTEYRAVDTRTRKEFFNYKLKEATNNIGEFLGIVHTLALFKKENKPLKIIYSDSQNAILWVRKKECKTKLTPTENNRKTFEVIERAVNWLKNNDYDTKILKWNTAVWGEIPADYGRK